MCKCKFADKETGECNASRTDICPMGNGPDDTHAPSAASEGMYCEACRNSMTDSEACYYGGKLICTHCAREHGII